MRGHKQSNGLPFSRAREVQREFRARRVRHLEDLEQRIEELEVENVRLCQALNLLPVIRRPLGRGPTGWDVLKLQQRKERRKTNEKESSFYSDSPPSLQNAQETSWPAHATLQPTQGNSPELHSRFQKTSNFHHRDDVDRIMTWEGLNLQFGPPAGYSQHLALSCQLTHHLPRTFSTDLNAPRFEIDPPLSSLHLGQPHDFEILPITRHSLDNQEVLEA